jgi:phenylalanyl-tRNA synthetase beta chain
MLPLNDEKSGRTASDPLFHPRASLRLTLPTKGVLGTVGLLHPQAARAWGLERQQVSLFQIDLDLLAGLEPARNKFQAFSVFPGVDRDISFLVDAATAYGQVTETIRARTAEGLRDIELVDKFTGQGVPEGKQSLTVRLRFGRNDRTLKDEEVNAAMENILAELSRRHGAVLRS